MTEEEKYKEIVDSRNVATESKDDQSGVKTDPPAKDNAETEAKPEAVEEKAKGQEQEKAPAAKAELTNEQKQEHAIAALRVKMKRENDALRKELAEYKASQANKDSTPKEKTRSEFENDEEYGKYIRAQIKDEVKAEILKEMEEKKSSEDIREKFNTELSKELDGIKEGLSKSVFADLRDPDSDLSMILTDERAESIAETIKNSNRRADLLALMQAKPQIFQDMLSLPPKKQEYRLYMLEDQIEAQYQKLKEKQQSDKQKEERAASLPTAGAFGVNGSGATDISGLSTEARVARYKQEMLKNRY